MKFSDFRDFLRAPQPPSPKIVVFVPAIKGSPEFYRETIDLRSGKCPVCGSKILVYPVAGTGEFFGCVKVPYHYYFREGLKC